MAYFGSRIHRLSSIALCSPGIFRSVVHVEDFPPINRRASYSRLPHLVHIVYSQKSNFYVADKPLKCSPIPRDIFAILKELVSFLIIVGNTGFIYSGVLACNATHREGVLKKAGEYLSR